MFGFFKRHFKLIILVALIAFASVYFFQAKIKSSGKKVETVKVARGTLTEKLTISGTVEAEEKIALKFQASGRLSWVGVKTGDYVKKYQGIASLDQRDVEKNLKKKLLAYMNERWDFEQGRDDKSVRGREMYQVPGLTDSERRVLDKAQFDLNSTVLDVEIAALAKEYSFLWTPIEGLVTKIDTPFAGTNITPATAEFEIINPKSVYFSANADQSEVVTLKDGQLGELILDSYPESTIAGTVRSIAFTPKAGETSTVYEVKFSINDGNTNYKYRVGMGGDLSFVTKKKVEALYLPAKFIRSENGKKYVMIKSAGKDKKEYVETGMETDTDIEIVSGIKEGDTVYE